MSLLFTELYRYYLGERKKTLSNAEKKDICIEDKLKLKYLLRDERKKYDLQILKRKNDKDESSCSKTKKPKQ